MLFLFRSLLTGSTCTLELNKRVFISPRDFKISNFQRDSAICSVFSRSSQVKLTKLNCKQVDELLEGDYLACFIY